MSLSVFDHFVRRLGSLKAELISEADLSRLGPYGHNDLAAALAHIDLAIVSLDTALLHQTEWLNALAKAKED